jgi:DNA-binding NtrC family response regulator
VNVAALPRELLESELFGHERGAFTSAVRMRKGRFELADGGTLFLDEIAECPVEVQVKLLRVLQEQEFERLGGSETIRTDVRMIFATNRDLKTEMAAGRFRQDLYFRINVIQIPVAPLRERKDDIDILVPHFVKDFNQRENRVKKTTPGLMEVLRAYNWPGNVRELRNAVEHAYLLSSGDELRADALPDDILERTGGPRVHVPTSAYPPDQPSAPTAEASNNGQTLTVPLAMKMDEVEKQFILAVYAKSGKNKTLAAKMLGIGLKTLYRKLIKYGEMSQHEAPDIKDTKDDAE